MDNVVRRGNVVDESSPDPDVQGIRKVAERINRLRQLEATVIQTVSIKGHDGFAIVLVE